MRRNPSAFVRLIARTPFTSAYVLVTVVAAIALGTLWSPIASKSWFFTVAYGLPTFEDGRWSTLVLGNFFALFPIYYFFVAGAFAVLTGFAEWKLGTARTVVIAVTFQFGAVLLSALLFLIFRDSGWEWAAARSTETDVGFSAGMLAALSVASAAVRPPWRLRLRLAIWTYVGFSILFVGQMADLEHLIAVATSLPFSTRLAGRHGLRARAFPTRREIRWLALVGMIVTAAAQLVGVAWPDRLTPFGLDTQSSTWSALAVNLVITLLIANGLRHGYQWAWWVEVVLLAVPLLLAAVVAVAAVVLLFVPDGEADLAGAPQFTANVLLSLAFFVLLIRARRAFA